MSDVVVVGNAGIDTNVFLYGADVDFSVEANFSDTLDTVGQAGGYSSRGYVGGGDGGAGESGGGRCLTGGAAS